jgi:hypothetical protein
VDQRGDAPTTIRTITTTTPQTEMQLWSGCALCWPVFFAFQLLSTSSLSFVEPVVWRARLVVASDRNRRVRALSTS